jgi:exodeoxyribonuclease V alpha subunit
MPLMREDGSSDFYVIAADNSEEIQAKLLRVVTKRIPQRFGLHPIRDVQVLTPMNRGSLGARALNTVALPFVTILCHLRQGESRDARRAEGR